MQQPKHNEDKKGPCRCNCTICENFVICENAVYDEDQQRFSQVSPDEVMNDFYMGDGEELQF